MQWYPLKDFVFPEIVSIEIAVFGEDIFPAQSNNFTSSLRKKRKDLSSHYLFQKPGANKCWGIYDHLPLTSKFKIGHVDLPDGDS